MTDPEVKEYKKRSDTIPGIQWNGDLGEVPGISNWVIEQDINATVSAKFTSDALILSIQTNGQLISVKALDYIVVTDKGLHAIEPAVFLNMYELVEEKLGEAPVEETVEIPEEVV